MIKRDKGKEKLSAEIARLHQQVADLVASRYKIRKRASKLQATQRRFAILAQTAFEGIAIHDGNRILDTNQKLARMLGYRISELKGMNLGFLFAPQSRPLASSIIQDRYRKPSEVICLKKDESTFNAEISSRVFSYEGEKIKVIFIHDITSLKKAEAKIKHLNAVLRAIRLVNQLIVKEKDRKKLINQACHNLIKTFGYGNAWIALFDKRRKLIGNAEAGFGRHFKPMLKLLQQGQLPACAKNALLRPSILTIRHPEIQCPDCPLRSKYNGRGPMIIRLQYKERIYGLLSVSIPQEFLSEKEEKSLFKEVAGDLAFALYSLELEEAQKKAEIKVREARDFAEGIVATIREPLLVLDRNLKVISANRSFYKLFKTLPPETEGKVIYELGNQQWDIPKLKELLDKILPQNTSFDNFEVTHDFPGLGRRTMLLNARRIYREANKTQMILLAIEDITERKRTEAEILSYREKLRQLALKLSRAEEMERRKMAAFLHDQISQKLALAKIELGTLSGSATEIKVVKDQVKKLRKLIEETIKDSRQLTFDLMPPLLYELGFVKSLKWLVNQYKKNYKLQCELRGDGRFKPLGPDLGSFLFRAVRELMMNIVKHAQTDKVRVTVNQVKNVIKVIVEDEGIGFDISKVNPYSPKAGGFGLFYIRERLKDFEGGLEIKSEKGKGTKIAFWAPLKINKKRQNKFKPL